MLSYYVILYEKFRKVMQQTEKVALINESNLSEINVHFECLGYTHILTVQNTRICHVHGFHNFYGNFYDIIQFIM